MSDHCCAHTPKAGESHNDPRWRRVLWFALIANAAMFFVEIWAGAASGSRALVADALDFFGDAANYAISLGVASMALKWRARTALAKGIVIIVFGCGLLLSSIWGLVDGSTPEPWTMTSIGALALVVNVTVALLLFRYRSGDADMRSVWICSRNDAINNCLVIAAGFAVLLTGSGIPDLLVALVMASLGISGGWQVIQQARTELQSEWRRSKPAITIDRELAAYRAARGADDTEAAWEALGRVHIISQRYFWPHIQSHVEMLRFAVTQQESREVFGQLLRLALAPLGNITGKLPIGNTGRANVSAFLPMDIPTDLQVAVGKHPE